MSVHVGYTVTDNTVPQGDSGPSTLRLTQSYTPTKSLQIIPRQWGPVRGQASPTVGERLDNHGPDIRERIITMRVEYLEAEERARLVGQLRRVQSGEITNDEKYDLFTELAQKFGHNSLAESLKDFGLT